MINKRIQLYENRTDVTLTTYVLDDSSEMLDGKNRPAVLICPGGAYLNCSDREGEPVAMAFAAMGYHAFVLRYSVLGGDPSPLFEDEEAYQHGDYDDNKRHPQPIRDIGKAILTIAEHNPHWHVNMDKIILCGFSAGGHNCGNYATHWHEPVLSDYFNEPSHKFKPAAAILGYMLSDYLYMKEVTGSGSELDRRLFKISNRSFLGTIHPTDEELTEVSPAMNVSEKTPPMFLWTTADDTLVPAQHTLTMAQALSDQNIPYELHVYESGDHGLSLATQASAGKPDHKIPDVAGWVGRADQWLKRRFALPDPSH